MFHFAITFRLENHRGSIVQAFLRTPRSTLLETPKIGMWHTRPAISLNIDLQQGTKIFIVAFASSATPVLKRFAVACVFVRMTGYK